MIEEVTIYSMDKVHQVIYEMPAPLVFTRGESHVIKFDHHATELQAMRLPMPLLVDARFLENKAFITITNLSDLEVTLFMFKVYGRNIYKEVKEL